ncbi:hypothetical protein [Methylobacterium soli]|uniref:Uncharacterized protein n=1 Tax=Methylobacterium soli TaxID=553447 RepID=A0A6L3SZ57_9HYPH|nr:hypothetical protein [Methylobacterium soli]KAB1079401.1 hypothetical protein F6X53_11400 [Methylobacterium soli]
MTLRTSVIDTADWRLAIPLQAPGDPLDFSGTLLTIALTPILGGPPIATADSEAGTLAFMPASGAIPAYFALDLRVKDRTWRISAPTDVVGDVLRHPDPAFPAYIEWLGRVRLKVLPGSNSSGIAAAAGFSPVLIDAQPYDGRIVTAPMAFGPQGVPAYPAFDPIADEGKALRIVDGVPTWV